jgi:endonuclease YncB( thermonuclease family)
MKGTELSRERKPVLGLVILLALALAYPPDTLPGSAADSITFKGLVVGIEDGDTLTVLRNRTRFSVEVVGVDAPELDQPYGQEARRMVAALVKNRVVIIRAHRSLRQGRIIGEVWLKDRRNPANELVRTGLAWVKKGAAPEAEITRLEADAKAARRGLWKDIKPGLVKDEEPIPPWEWRQGRR